MGRKLIRDFVPGLRAVSGGTFNGKIRFADNADERCLLGAEKVVEEAHELLLAYKSDNYSAILLEVADVYAALRYFCENVGIDLEEALEKKEELKGGFTKNFVWEWDGEIQPRSPLADEVMPAAGRAAAPDDPDLAPLVR